MKKLDLLITKDTTISDIVKAMYDVDSAFKDLSADRQYAVLEYIENNHLNLKAFGLKGFDVISQTFFVEKYTKDAHYFPGFHHEVINFCTFEQFFGYVGNYMYDDACYFGYSFSDEEINTYKLDVTKLNFDAFIDYTIDQFSLNELTKQKEKDSAEKRALVSKMTKLLPKIQKLTDYEDFVAFMDCFDFVYRQKISDAFHVVLSLIAQTQNQLLIDYVCQYFCENDFGSDELFGILLRCGEQAAQYVIDHFKVDNDYISGTTSKRRLREFKKQFKVRSEIKLIKSVSGFDNVNSMYYVVKTYCNAEGRRYQCADYYLSFDKFAESLGGDLRHSDLQNAPISIEELNQYKVDETTKMPKVVQFTQYVINKKFADRKFVVCQKLLDSEDNVIIHDEKSFVHFCDFVHFLKGDLSGGDFLDCEGFQNIRTVNNLCLDSILVRSDIAEMLGLEIKTIDFTHDSFETSEKNELATIDTFALQHITEEENKEISYVTDIHLEHRFLANKCKTASDLEYLLRTVAGKLKKDIVGTNLIGGDITSNFTLYKQFAKHLSSKFIYNFLTLGNHELWCHSGESLDEIVAKYDKILRTNGLYLVQNNAYYFSPNGIQKITTQELLSFSCSDLRTKVKDAYLIIFGGIGFSGQNNAFNANNGVYRDTIDRDEEIKQSEFFYKLYLKVIDVFCDKHLIVLTHMPMSDWAPEEKHVDGVVYVSGHNHKNYFYDDSIKRIYADNQIGYKQKEVTIKKFSIDYDYDWFNDYADGIYEITNHDYIKFYRGLCQTISFGRQYEKLYMLKREGMYMFLLQNIGGRLMVLNGGSIKSAGEHTLDYFYENMTNYAQSVKLFLKDYGQFQKQIANDVKRIGGYGTIHGCIIDIDFYNHLYVNPLDGTITSYFAKSIVDKDVYANVGSLLKYECPNLFLNYEKLLNDTTSSALFVKSAQSLEVSSKKRHVTDTQMYRISRIIKGLQYTLKRNVIRLWNDSLATECTVDNGKRIVSNLIDSKDMSSEKH